MTYSKDNSADYIEDRIEQYRQWYDSKAIKMKSNYLRSRIATAVSAVLIPVIANMSLSKAMFGETYDVSKLLVTALGLLVAVLVALEGVLHHREQWKNYRTTEQYLQTQKQLFLHRIGDYKSLDDGEAFKLLVGRAEAAIAEENAITLNVLARVEPEQPKGQA